MLASMKSLDGPLAAAGVPGAAKAFETLRPGAFKADLWRYAILWGCGGIYVDSKTPSPILSVSSSGPRLKRVSLIAN